jgi:hypothetical protein
MTGLMPSALSRAQGMGIISLVSDESAERPNRGKEVVCGTGEKRQHVFAWG